MGSQLSQSQQLRNTFPLSEYKILPCDKSFPELTFLQKLSDCAVFAVRVVDKSKENYEPSNSKHVIKRVEKKEFNKKVFELYEWANANVQGLVEYITLVDKNRKISKSEFNAIVQGAVRGFSSVSKQCFEIECLEVSMRKLRIFNEISLKAGQFNSKEVVNSILVKVLPKSLEDSLQKTESYSEIWGHVGSCIHQGGILTEKQLLGEYLLQLSNYATKHDSKNKQESLKNLKSAFGIRSLKTVEALLANEDWKQVVKILDQPKTEETIVSPLKQICNSPKVNSPTHDTKHKKSQTQKTIDTEKTKSEKILFQCFKNEQKTSNPTTNTAANVFTNKARQSNPIDMSKVIPVMMDRSRVNSTQYYKSVSPMKSDKYLSPPSIKIIRQASPPAVNKGDYQYQTHNNNNANKQEDYAGIDNLKLTRTNSVLTIFPDIFRQETTPTRNRILSAKNVPLQMFSPEGRTAQTQYLNSPRMNSPKYEKENEVSRQKTNQVQKRKGRKIEFKPSKENPTLKETSIPEYVWKIKVDKVEAGKKESDSGTEKKGRSDSFLSQQFSDLKFQLSDKYFVPDSKKNHFFSPQLEKNNLQKSPKIEIKPSSNTNSKPPASNFLDPKHVNDPSKPQSKDRIFKDTLSPQSNPNGHINIKEANSQTILIDPQSMSFMINTNNKAPEVLPEKVEHKESKYVGPVNMKGQKQGEGKLYFPSGGYYVGHFYKDFMHGNGKLYYPSGRVAYEGNFKYDKFHGSGKLYNQSPSFISSFDFRNFNRLEVTEKQQPIHKEHFLISPVQKQRKISYWKHYEGEMNYDMKHGKGVLVLENGERYEGEFRDDLVSGKGVFYGQNGKISGRWEDNLLVELYR